MSRPLKIVIGAHTPHGTPYIVGSHHLAREFKKLGHDVFHIPLPLGPQDAFLPDVSNVKRLRWGGWKVTRRGLDPIRDDQFLLVYLPWTIVRRLGFRLAERLGYGNFTSPSVNRISSPDILIVDHPKQFWLVNRLKPRTMIYRPTDAYSYVGHKDDGIFKDIESWLLRHAAGVVLTASETMVRMLSLCKDFPPPPIRVLENGVDLTAFANISLSPPPALHAVSRPRLLYVGTFDDRIDYDFIVAAARRMPSHSFVLGGPMTSEQKARFQSITNVFLLGGLPYKDLHLFMSHCDIGIMPMSSHPFNATRSPMKLYEFAACGLPMVAKGTPELRRRNLPFCFMYETLAQFEDSVDQAMVYKAAHENDIKNSALGKSWSVIATEILTFCDEINV